MSQTQEVPKFSGEVIYVDEIKTPSEKYPDFKVQTFGLRSTEMVNFQPVIKTLSFQSNMKDIVEKTNTLSIGDKIEVEFYPTVGKVNEDNTKKGTPRNPNNKSCIVNLIAISCKIIEKTTQPIAGQDVTNTTTEIKSTHSGKIKPDVIAEGYQWNETIGELEETPPF